jgi:hypothetical protein
MLFLPIPASADRRSKFSTTNPCVKRETRSAVPDGGATCVRAYGDRIHRAQSNPPYIAKPSLEGSTTTFSAKPVPSSQAKRRFGPDWAACRPRAMDRKGAARVPLP